MSTSKCNSIFSVISICCSTCNRIRMNCSKTTTIVLKLNIKTNLITNYVSIIFVVCNTGTVTVTFTASKFVLLVSCLVIGLPFSTCYSNIKKQKHFQKLSPHFYLFGIVPKRISRSTFLYG